LLQECKKCQGETWQERDTAEESILLLFQLFAEMSITFVAVYPSYISGECKSYSLKKVTILQFFLAFDFGMSQSAKQTARPGQAEGRQTDRHSSATGGRSVQQAGRGTG
jgi:hypothetical protein